MSAEQDHLLHALTRAVLNIGWHVGRLRGGEAEKEIAGYLETLDEALRKAVPGRKEDRR
jgi:hypothetical protein